ncbi:MAG: DUF1906 domain-containing protein [Lachnospiraceae bacterium]|nr:DUF1906 domain-containing protein [Lachnospiraceae bacterium]
MFNKLLGKIKNMGMKSKIALCLMFTVIISVCIGIGTSHKSKAYDVKVLEAQQWLNATYTGKKGYVVIPEDGVIGQGTVKALIRALQIETGDSAPDGIFGNGTIKRCPTVASSNDASENVIKILQYGLFCKGYNAGAVNGEYHDNTKAAVNKLQTDAGFEPDGIVTPQWFKAILNTDAMVLIKGGDKNIRTVQQYLNRNYYQYVGIKPCDGVYSRDTNKAMIYALQVEEGDSKPDGVFGNGTYNNCPTLSQGSTKTRFVKLVQAAAYTNGYYKNFSFDGVYDAELTNEVKAFQKFMKLPDTNGTTTKGTMKSLLVSCGDKNRPGTGCDTATRLDEAKIATLKNEGYKYVGRYLTKVPGGLDKNMTREEAKLITKSGLKIIPIYQTYGREDTYFTVEQGNIDAIEAITAAVNLGIPNGSTIYFGVDYDVLDKNVTAYIIPYFKAINARFSAYGNKYNIGIYGCRNACTRVSEANLAKYAYVSDMSTGYSGNMGYRMPKNWAFDQINEFTTGSGSGALGIDKLVVSGRDAGVSKINKNVAKVDEQTVAMLSGYYSADPVNLASGAHEIEYDAFTVYGSQNINITLSYSSEATADGAVGKGWTYGYETYVKEISDDDETEEDETAIRLYVSPAVYRDYYPEVKETEDGKEEKSQDVYICDNILRKNDRLTKNEDQTYTLDCNGENVYTFNKSGKLVKEETKSGFSVNIEYTDNSVKICDAKSDSYIELIKNEDGKVTEITDGTDRKTLLSYDENSCLVSITDANGNTTSYTYDDAARVLTGTDNNGATYFTNEYDELGRVSAQYDSNGAKTEFSYDDTEKNGTTLVTVTDRNGNKSTSLFSDKRQLLEETDKNGNKTVYTYDENNNITRIQDPLKVENVTRYDDKNRLVYEEDSKGFIVTYEYDDNNNITRKLYSTGAEETFEYNKDNKLVKAVAINGLVSTFEYDKNGYLSKKSEGDTVYTFEYKDGKLASATDPMGNRVYYEYDENGLLKSTKDAEGNVSSQEYDEVGNITKVINADGGVSSTAYDRKGLITSHTDTLGNTSTREYDSNDNLVKETFADGNYIEYIYDAADRIEKTTDQKGNVTSYEYDKAGQVTAVIYPDKAKETYEYDANGNVTKHTTAEGVTTEYTYDTEGNVLTETSGDGTTVTYEYDVMSNLVKVTNPKGGVTEYTRDDTGKVTKETDPNGNSVTYKYNIDGKLEKMTDAKGNVTKYEYNVAGLLTKITDPLGNSTSYEYDKLGNLVKVTDPLGGTVTYEYDECSREIAVTDANGNTTRKEYDTNGNVVKTYDAKGNVDLIFTYNALGQPDKVTDIYGNFMTSEYDKNGNLISSTDTRGVVTRYEYDELNRMVKSINALGDTSSVEYTKDGQVSVVKGALGSTKSYEYDEFQRLISESTTSGGKITYKYNAAGLLEEKKNARGQSETYTYDKAGNITKIVNSEGTTTYKYDENYNITEVKDSTGTVKRTFDKLDRVLTYTDVNGKTVSYEYDAAGNLVKMTYPDDTYVTYKYDKAGNVIKVTDWNGNETSYKYDENNDIIKVTRPDGSILTKAYDEKGRLTSAKDTAKDGIVISSYTYEYDEMNNITSETSETDKIRYEYSYDILYRLTERKTVLTETGEVAEKENFTYDSACNIIVSGSSEGTSERNYNANNQLLSMDGNGFVYDKDGNMTSGVIGGDDALLAYDSQNRLVKMSKDGITYSYTYDAEGIRTSKVTEGKDGKKTSKYTYNLVSDLTELIYEETEDSIIKYVYGAGSLVSQEEVKKDKKEISYFHYDLRGSTVALTDESGKVSDRYLYSTYGKVNAVEGSKESTEFLYNGRDGVMNEGNGLYYMRTRYYSPDLERFINADVLVGDIANSSTLNQYAYVEGSPVSMIDPFGLCAEPSSKNKTSKASKNNSSWWKKVTKKATPALKKVGSSLKSTFIGDTKSEMIHNALDLGGMLPGVGFVFDTANSIYYFSEGDYLNGAMSAASAVPGIGDAFSAAKKGSKGLGIAAKVGKSAGKTVAKEAGEKVGKEVVEEATERLVKEGTEEVAEKAMKNGSVEFLGECADGINCFTAGTKVSTIDGMKNIEDIKEGDYVLSKDPITGEVGYKKVLRTFVNTKEELVHIEVEGTLIETTKEHPFWVVGYGFKNAGDIEAGDYVVTAEGIEAEITFVETVEVEPTTTYNFEVEDWHTYFVSDAEIWVHNKCPFKWKMGDSYASYVSDVDVNINYLDQKYKVGLYEDIRGAVGLDAHHVGQKALMEKFVKDYDYLKAPAINVPKVGHTIKGEAGIVSRSTKGINNSRQLLARDLFELKRVYPDIPNSAFRELIDLNMEMYPEMRKIIR